MGIPAIVFQSRVLPGAGPGAVRSVIATLFFVQDGFIAVSKSGAHGGMEPEHITILGLDVCG